MDRHGRHEQAAIFTGCALSALTSLSVSGLASAIAHLREVLGDQTYESLAATGQAMTTSEMTKYAYDQIDQTHAMLSAVSK